MTTTVVYFRILIKMFKSNRSDELPQVEKMVIIHLLQLILKLFSLSFDGLIVSFPELSSHLATIAEVVVFPDFEIAIVKIQRGNEAHLKNHERRAVLQFLKNASGQAVSKNEERKEEPGLSFIEGCAIKKQRLQSSSKYINTLIVAPVSDICEQVFSRAKYIMIPTRRRMDSSTLEDILLLKFNLIIMFYFH
jgi:hypothetical protein